MDNAGIFYGYWEYFIDVCYIVRCFGAFFRFGTLCQEKSGNPMVYFQTKNLNLGKFWRVLEWKVLVYFIGIWNNLRPIGIFYGYLVHFVVH
jgi:hypothetical protein